MKKTEVDAEMALRDARAEALQNALISFDPVAYLPAFHAEIFRTEQNITEDEFVMVENEFGEEITTIPNLDGVTVSYSKPPTAEEAEEIFKQMLSNTSGTLKMEDFLGSPDA